MHTTRNLHLIAPCILLHPCYIRLHSNNPKIRRLSDDRCSCFPATKNNRKPESTNLIVNASWIAYTSVRKIAITSKKLNLALSWALPLHYIRASQFFSFLQSAGTPTAPGGGPNIAPETGFCADHYYDLHDRMRTLGHSDSHLKKAASFKDSPLAPLTGSLSLGLQGTRHHLPLSFPTRARPFSKTGAPPPRDLRPRHAHPPPPHTPCAGTSPQNLRPVELLRHGPPAGGQPPRGQHVMARLPHLEAGAPVPRRRRGRAEGL